MNAKRLTILVATGILVTGCGVTADVVGGPHSTAPVTAALTLSHGASAPTAAATPAPAATPTAAPVAAPLAPQVIVLADEGNFNGATFGVELVATDGRVIASTQVPQDARWTVGSGAGAAYWVTAGTLEKLTASGVTTLAAVPRTESGRVVISPDGSRWAYATTSQDAAGLITNRLYTGAAGEAERLVAERTADPNHPRADTPGPWQYYLMSWTARGILIERQPVGGCGCGTPFDMQMSAGYAAFIDPSTGVATPLAASPSCPLSGVGVDGTLACFHVLSNGASDSIQFSSGTAVSHRYQLSGRTDGGDATFNGSTIAYATVPDTAGGCGDPDWRPQTSLRVMNIQTGVAHSIGGAGLAPAAWLSDGSILATLSIAHAGNTSSSVVDVDPLTGSMRTVFRQSFDVVGLA